MKRLLIIDDEENVGTFLSQFLERKGFAAAVAGSAEEGCRMLETDPSYDLIILDLILPDGDGVELSSVFHKRWPQIPILVLTGLFDAEIEADLRRNGVFFCCPKTLEIKLLLETIQRAMAASPASGPQGAAAAGALGLPSTSAMVLSNASLG